MHYCKVPECAKVATEKWATVPICHKHYDEIADETDRYYAKRIQADERETYLSIRRFTPWGRISERKAAKRS